MKKIIVFGGSGFLGTYVVNELISRGYDVISADIQKSKFIDDALFKHCDIESYDEVKQILTEEFDYIYNFAGFANLDRAIHQPLKTIQLNVLGNLNILDVAKEVGIKRFIFASSAYAMSDKGSFYGISKLTSEKLVEEYYKRYGIKYSIIRYGSVYSERDSDNNYVYSIVKEALLTKQINHNGDGEETREYIHAADAARLSADILEEEEYENQNIILTGFERMKRKDLFEMIREISSESIKINLSKSGYDHHYKISPYSFHPTLSKKLVANPFIDMGQGILECIKSVHQNYNQK